MKIGNVIDDREMINKGHEAFRRLSKDVIGEVESLVQKRLHYPEASEL